VRSATRNDPRPSRKSLAAALARVAQPDASRARSRAPWPPRGAAASRTRQADSTSVDCFTGGSRSRPNSGHPWNCPGSSARTRVPRGTSVLDRAVTAPSGVAVAALAAHDEREHRRATGDRQLPLKASAGGSRSRPSARRPWDRPLITLLEDLPPGGTGVQDRAGTSVSESGRGRGARGAGRTSRAR
jgi:hypothetical protein